MALKSGAALRDPGSVDVPRYAARAMRSAISLPSVPLNLRRCVDVIVRQQRRQGESGHSAQHNKVVESVATAGTVAVHTDDGITAAFADVEIVSDVSCIDVLMDGAPINRSLMSSTSPPEAGAAVLKSVMSGSIERQFFGVFVRVDQPVLCSRFQNRRFVGVYVEASPLTETDSKTWKRQLSTSAT